MSELRAACFFRLVALWLPMLLLHPTAVVFQDATFLGSQAVLAFAMNLLQDDVCLAIERFVAVFSLKHLQLRTFHMTLLKVWK